MNRKTIQYAAYKKAKLTVMALGLPALSDPEHPLPLRVGVRDDLAKIVGGEVANDFLLCWTKRHEYRELLVEGATRYALDGTPDGAVTGEHLLRKTAVIPKTSGPISNRIREARNKLRAEGITRDNAQRLEAKIARLEKEREDLYPEAAAQSRSDLGLLKS